jgi:hypothetical protein
MTDGYDPSGGNPPLPDPAQRDQRQLQKNPDGHKPVAQRRAYDVDDRHTDGHSEDNGQSTHDDRHRANDDGDRAYQDDNGHDIGSHDNGHGHEPGRQTGDDQYRLDPRPGGCYAVEASTTLPRTPAPWAPARRPAPTLATRLRLAARCPAPTLVAVLHDVRQRLVAQVAAYLLTDESERAALCGDGVSREMRSDQNPRSVPERMIDGQRLWIGHIERSSEASCPQQLKERLRVEDRPARRVDEQCSRAQARE